MSASSAYKNLKIRGAKNAMDKNTRTYYTSNAALDWLQIDLGREYVVTGLDVTKRSGYERMFRNIEVALIKKMDLHISRSRGDHFPFHRGLPSRFFMGPLNQAEFTKPLSFFKNTYNERKKSCFWHYGFEELNVNVRKYPNVSSYETSSEWGIKI